ALGLIEDQHLRSAFQTQSMHEHLESLAHPGAKEAVEVKGAKASDGGDALEFERLVQVALDVVHDPVHTSGILSARGLGSEYSHPCPLSATLDHASGTDPNDANFLRKADTSFGCNRYQGPGQAASALRRIGLALRSAS